MTRPSAEMVRWSALCFGTVLFTYVVLQPDWAHTQNRIDPFFYTGMHLNLDAVVGQGAAAHYFLSRWSLYLPEHVGRLLVGPTWGYLGYRIVLLGVISIGLASLRSVHQRRLDLLAVVVIVALQPFVVRSVFVDYSDAVVVPCGFLLVAICAQAEMRRLTSVVVGLVAALAIIANPFAIWMVTVTCAVYLARGTAIRALVHLAISAGTAVSVALAGLVYFRVRFGIQNLYRPAIDFILESGGPGGGGTIADYEWMLYRIWIYLPPIVLTVAAITQARGLVRWAPWQLRVFVVCAIQYAFQVSYEVIFDFATLEIHYYFSYAIPAYIASLVIVLLALAERAGRWFPLTVAAALAGAVVVFRDRPDVDLGSWVQASAVVVLLVAAVAWTPPRLFPQVSVVALVAVSFSFQQLAPGPEPVRDNAPDFSYIAGFDEAFSTHPEGPQVFRALEQFDRLIRQLPEGYLERSVYYVDNGAGVFDLGANPLASALSVQVSRPTHWLNQRPLAGGEEARAIIRELGYTHAVVLVPREDLQSTIDQLGDVGIELAPTARIDESIEIDGMEIVVYIADVLVHDR